MLGDQGQLASASLDGMRKHSDTESVMSDDKKLSPYCIGLTPIALA
jgi:hypothetical protein